MIPLQLLQIMVISVHKTTAYIILYALLFTSHFGRERLLSDPSSQSVELNAVV